MAAKNAGKEKKPKGSSKKSNKSKSTSVEMLIRMNANAIVPTDEDSEKLLQEAKYVAKETSAGTIYYHPSKAKFIK